MILKIVIIAIICIFLSSVLKRHNEEFGLIVNIAGSVIIFLLCVEKLQDIVDYFFKLNSVSNLNVDFMTTLLKVIGIGYVTEFTVDIAEDFGNKIIASKVLLGGKIIICGMTLPIIEKLFSVLLSLLS